MLSRRRKRLGRCLDPLVRRIAGNNYFHSSKKKRKCVDRRGEEEEEGRVAWCVSKN
jgi:hypothetical protein